MTNVCIRLTEKRVHPSESLTYLTLQTFMEHSVHRCSMS